MCSKSIEIEAVFTKTEMNIKETLVHFKIVPLAFYTIIPMTFPVVEAPMKLFECGVKLHHHISLDASLHPLILLEIKFQLRKQENVMWN